MRIGIIGFGYVGSAAANGFKKRGHIIYVYDTAEKALKKAKVEHYKTYNSLEELVHKSEIIFVCVPTPLNGNGSSDSSIVQKTVENVARLCQKETIIVIKSTVIVGTTDKLIDAVKAKNSMLHVLVNPEFLTTKRSYKDFLNPDRIVIGGYDKKSMNVLYDLYKDFSKTILIVDPNTAELAKYASNSFLATKVSFANQIKLACKRMRANPSKVMKIVGLDRRIGYSHLNPSKGPFGGMCLSKDLDAFIFETERRGIDNCLLKAVKEINEKVKRNANSNK